VSETRKYRQFSPDQKAETVLAGLRGDRAARDVCREYEIAETLYYQWGSGCWRRSAQLCIGARSSALGAYVPRSAEFDRIDAR
jgi:transposase-like protein